MGDHLLLNREKQEKRVLFAKVKLRNLIWSQNEIKQKTCKTKQQTNHILFARAPCINKKTERKLTVAVKKGQV